MPKLEPYRRDLPYSYALGVFPSLTLIEARPEAARRLLLHPDAENGEGVTLLRERCRALGVREELAPRALKRESRKDNCYAALLFDKFEDELAEGQPHAVLCQISDGGNLGTALRALLGFGIRDAAIIRPAVDAFEPHVLRASMGAMCRMRVRAFEAFEQYRALYPAHALYPFMLDGAVPLAQAAASPARPWALLFGNEQTGLPARFARLGQSVRIPQSDQIDSFNLAVSVAVAAYAFTQGGAQGQ